MSNFTPIISVIMPVYNAAPYLAEAIGSILNQTYKNFEFIIVDDASTDSSWKIISNYKKTYPSIIKSFRLTKRLNRGGDACANIAFHKSRGQFIARMDADDISHPHRLATQLKFLQDHPHVIIVGSQAHVINHASKITGQKTVPTSHADIYQNYFIFHPLIHPSVMIRRSLLPKRHDLYKIKYSANKDLYTFFELLHHGQFANLDEKLIYYRIHGQNDSLVQPKNRFLNTLRIRLHAVIKYGYIPTLKSILLTLAQLIIVIALPENIIIPLYMKTKGIYNHSHETFYPTPRLAHL